MNIQGYLQNYNKNLSKIEINNAKLKTLKLLLENWDGSCEALKGQVLNDMPFGGDGTDKTVSAVIKKEELEQRIADMELDMSYHQQRIQLVDSKIRLLNDNERVVITNKYIDNIHNRDRLVESYKNEFGIRVTPTQIYRIINNAIKKMK